MAFLNNHIAPHELLGFSIFEDDHPCNNKLYHAVIIHKGNGATPLNKGADIKGDIYKLKIYNEDTNWNTIIQHVC